MERERERRERRERERVKMLKLGSLFYTKGRGTI